MRETGIKVAKQLTGAAGAAVSEQAYVHHVRGRLRVQAPALRKNPIALKHLGHQFGTFVGVCRIATNPLIGSITVEYRTDADLPALLGVFHNHRIEIRPVISPPSLSITATSPWWTFFAAGFAAHLLFDLLVLGLAGTALVIR